MAGPVIPRALGVPPQQQAPQQWQPEPFVDPNEEQRRQLQARMEALGNEQMYSPEVQQQRKQQNDFEYQMGLLAQLSGSEQLHGVGGQVLKKAMADREQKVSDKGAFDPVTGQWTFSPEYKRERLQGQLDKADASSAAYRDRYDTSIRDIRARTAARQDQQAFQAQMHADTLANRPEPLVAVMGPDGVTPTLVPRSQAVGMRPLKGGGAGGGGNPSEGERNAAGFHAVMQHATGLLDTFEGDGRPNEITAALGAIPMIGGWAQNRQMTTQQQLYLQAAQSWVRAKLRKESGASIGKDEMAQEIRTYFPMPGDSDENIAQKRGFREVANQAMAAAAGRASGAMGAPPGAAPGAAAGPAGAAGGTDPSDPLGWRKKRGP